MAFFTVHHQKDGRISTGSVAHYYKDCKQLKRRVGIIQDTGPVAQMLAKCSTCQDRLERIKK